MSTPSQSNLTLFTIRISIRCCPFDVPSWLSILAPVIHRASVFTFFDLCHLLLYLQYLLSSQCPISSQLTSSFLHQVLLSTSPSFPVSFITWPVAVQSLEALPDHLGRVSPPPWNSHNTPLSASSGVSVPAHHQFMLSGYTPSYNRMWSGCMTL